MAREMEVPALGNAQTIGTALQSTKVQLVILDGLTHEAELSAVDLVLPLVRQFRHHHDGRLLTRFDREREAAVARGHAPGAPATRAVTG
ncbi:hypothetical protein ABIF86_008099 [Bradyrhizobium japonicum]